jgi:predicted AlkP superfamily phosphohydrolase/phosphomutase
MGVEQKRANSPRVIAIGLEAVDPDLVERWCATGHLPVLASLRERGSWRRLRSTTEISSGTMWSSIASGALPGNHGSFFYHRQLQSGSYNIVKKYADETSREPVWFRLSEAGHRVAAIEVPAAKLHESINGIEIFSWGAQAPNLDPQHGTPAFLEELNARFGQHPLADWYEKKPGDAAAWEQLMARFCKGIESRTAMGKWILEREPWDFFIMVYPEGHTVGHISYHLLDETHPEHDPEVLRRCGNPLLKIYQEIDRGIGTLIAGADDATVLVFSNSGMGPNYSGIHLVGDVLHKLGFGSRLPGNERRQNFARSLLPSFKWGPYAIKEVEDLIGSKNIHRVKSLFPARFWDRWSRRVLALGSDWKNSRAFALPNDFSGAIRINLIGREPNGWVEPGAEYETLCDELIEAFSTLINPATGQPAVDKILKGDEVCAGKYREQFPDLLVVWNRDAPIKALQSERIGTVGGHLPDRRTGAHRVDGFLIACGSGLAKGRAAEDAAIVDIAPTILKIFGQAVPDHCDGRALEEIADPGDRIPAITN